MNGLLVTLDQVAQINALLPAHTQVAATADKYGNLYIGADLLGEIQDGGLYSAAASVIGALEQAEFLTPQQWDDKAAKARDAITAERDRRQSDGGVQVGGKWFLSNDKEQGRYNSLINAAVAQGVPGDYVIRPAWRTMQDGVTEDMTLSLARQILLAGLAVFCAIDDAAQAHKAAMQQSADPAAYDFSGGWPAIFGG